MAAREHDLLVVGGGATGACIAWDAALRGLKVALVEKEDFASGTSAASSKLIHGGLRYLKNLQFGVVRESLRERRVWSAVAPHMVEPLPFLMPTYGRGTRGRLALGLALRLYDRLGRDRDRLDDEDRRIPAHRRLRRDEALALEPGLLRKGLTGAMVLHDYQMHSPERLALAILQAAAEYGALVANHAEAEALLDGAGAVRGARVRDRLTGEVHVVRARMTVNAAGPWADQVLGRIEGATPLRVRLVLSKGIHVLTRPVAAGHAIAAQAPGHGHFFVLPWRGLSLLGTTDAPYHGDPGSVEATREDVEAFLRVVNEGFPGARLTLDDVRDRYAGVRPLLGADSSSYKASRRAEVLDHEADGVRNLLSALGGKWTTSRALAEAVVDRVVQKTGIPARACETHFTPVAGGEIGRLRSFLDRARRDHPGVEPDVLEHLVRNYGERYREVLDQVEPGDGRFFLGRPEIPAQIRHAVRNEMALTLEDALMRRTGIGVLGDPGDAVLRRACGIMARELGWGRAECRRQLDAVRRRYRPLDSPPGPGAASGEEE